MNVFDVPCTTSSVDKPAAAGLAPEWPITGVHHHVNLEMRVYDEPLLTDVTLEASVVGVDLQVDSEVKRMLEALVAVGAGVQTLVGVGQPVCSK